MSCAHRAMRATEANDRHLPELLRAAVWSELDLICHCEGERLTQREPEWPW
jgi:hypothetical protein